MTVLRVRVILTFLYLAFYGKRKCCKSVHSIGKWLRRCEQKVESWKVFCVQKLKLKLLKQQTMCVSFYVRVCTSAATVNNTCELPTAAASIKAEQRQVHVHLNFSFVTDTAAQSTSSDNTRQRW